MWLLLAWATTALAAPSLRPAAVLLSKEELSSLSSTESSLQSTLSQASGNSATAQLQAVSESLDDLFLRNLSREVTDRFLHHMKSQVDDLQSGIPDRLAASQKQLDHSLGLFYKCDAERVTALEFAERYVNVTSQKEKLHLQCRMEEAEAKRTSDKCDKASAELQRSLQEDPTCRSWPALKAMTASSAAADCKDPQAEESYEEYLERMRSEFDSQLLLYRGIKNACAAREKAIMNCDQEKIAYIQKLQVCNKMQYHLEKASCQHATELRDAWNGYSGCWSDINRRYRAEAAQASQLQEAQVKEFQATKKIECMLGGFRSPQPKKVLQKCEEEAQNASLPSELQISLLCPPAYRQPERLPLYPGSKGYETKYAGVPSEAPVTKSIRCLVEKAVNVSEAEQVPFDCEK